MLTRTAAAAISSPGTVADLLQRGAPNPPARRRRTPPAAATRRSARGWSGAAPGRAASRRSRPGSRRTPTALLRARSARPADRARERDGGHAAKAIGYVRPHDERARHSPAADGPSARSPTPTTAPARRTPRRPSPGSPAPAARWSSSSAPAPASSPRCCTATATRCSPPTRPRDAHPPRPTGAGHPRRRRRPSTSRCARAPSTWWSAASPSTGSTTTSRWPRSRGCSDPAACSRWPGTPTTTGIPWVRRLKKLICPRRGEAEDAALPLMETPYFGFVDEAQFRFWQPHTAASLADLARSVSYVATMSETERARVLAKVDALYAEYGRGHDGMQLPYDHALLPGRRTPPGAAARAPAADAGAPPRPRGRPRTSRARRSTRPAAPARGPRHPADRLPVRRAVDGGLRGPAQPVVRPTARQRRRPRHLPHPAHRLARLPRAAPGPDRRSRSSAACGTCAACSARRPSRSPTPTTCSGTTGSRPTTPTTRTPLAARAVADSAPWSPGRATSPATPPGAWSGTRIASPLVIDDRVAGALVALTDRPSAGLLRATEEVAAWVCGQLELAELDESAAPAGARRGAGAARPDQPALHLQLARRDRLVRAHRPRPRPRPAAGVRRLHPLLVPPARRVHHAGRGAALDRALPAARAGPLRRPDRGDPPGRAGGARREHPVPLPAAAGGERRAARPRGQRRAAAGSRSRPATPTASA